MVTDGDAALHVDALSVGYGNARVLDELSLTVKEGQVIALVGANGVGKTTLINTLSGFLKPNGGHIVFKQHDIGGLGTARIARMGLIQVSQNCDLFPNASVGTNLKRGAVKRCSVVELRRRLDDVYEYFPRLAERQMQLAGTLSGGEQRMLAIGRALMSKPQLLVLDEPSGGLAPQFVAAITEIMIQLKKRGSTMLIAEQNLRLATSAADHVHVIRDGRVAESITGADARADVDAFAQRVYLE